MYASVEDYAARYHGEPPVDLAQQLAAAQDDIDAMTYGRIARTGFESLTAFQQGKVKAAVCAQAKFLQDYGELVDNPLASYGVGGVSMSFREDAVQRRGGVATSSRVLALLLPTGLLSREV